MALCDTCAYYRAEYNEFRRDYEDSVSDADKGPEKHYCPMYDDHIPDDIYRDGADCPFYAKK